MKRNELKELIREELQNLVSSKLTDWLEQHIGDLPQDKWYESSFGMKNTRELIKMLNLPVASHSRTIKDVVSTLQGMGHKINLNQFVSQPQIWKRGSDEPLQIGRFSPTQGD